MIKKFPSLPPKIGNRTFQWKQEVKYLGVLLDTKLSFKNHITQSIQRANKAVSILFCILKKNSHASVESKMTIYRAYIRPILTYAGILFQNCPKTHFGRLQVMQNKSLRMALSKPYATRISKLHKEAKIPTIREFVDKNTKKFYETTKSHDNPLVVTLGNYTAGSVPFRVKHKLPKSI